MRRESGPRQLVVVADQVRCETGATASHILLAAEMLTATAPAALQRLPHTSVYGELEQQEVSIDFRALLRPA